MAKSEYQRRVAAERAARMNGERISEYFQTEKLTRPVLRGELLAILTQLEKGRKQGTLRSRIMRFLRAPLGSGPVHRVEPTAGEQARAAAEATPETGA